MYRIRDDKGVGFRCSFRNSFSEISDNGSIGVEQVCKSMSICLGSIKGKSGTITGHSWLSWYTCRNQDDLSFRESLFQAILIRLIASHNAFGIYMADVGSNTCVKSARVPSAQGIRKTDQGRL